jgi:hypothetical protein
MVTVIGFLKDKPAIGFVTSHRALRRFADSQEVIAIR